MSNRLRKSRQLRVSGPEMWRRVQAWAGEYARDHPDVAKAEALSQLEVVESEFNDLSYWAAIGERLASLPPTRAIRRLLDLGFRLGSLQANPQRELFREVVWLGSPEGLVAPRPGLG